MHSPTRDFQLSRSKSTLVWRRGISQFLLTVIFMLHGTVLWSSEPERGYDPCQHDSAICRSLAIEVARMDLAEYLDQEFAARQAPSKLCPDDNPDCCPPERHYQCAQMQREIVAELRRLHRSDSSSQYECPWTREVCESFGPFYCRPDEHWTPWGCQPGFVVDPPVRPQPWPPCKCGEEHNRKGYCVPKRCYLFGRRVGCPLTPDCEGEDQRISADHRADTPLARHLSDRAVQLEASRRLRDELKAKLQALEGHIAE